MAYNLESFLQILGQDQYHLILDCRFQIESVLTQTRILRRDFIDNPPAGIQNLDTRIRDAAHKAEDIIESHIITQVHSVDHSHLLDLRDVLHEFDSIRQALLTISVVRPLNDLPLLEVPDGPGSSSDNAVVGFDSDLDQLLDRLARGKSGVQCIPIVGMGGMGKTTLARIIYKHTIVSHHFDVCAWTKISQEFDARRTLLAILLSLNALTNEMHKEDEYTLGECVYKTLKCRRYLIIVDDIWNDLAWDRLKTFFPDDENGSRIIVTTRSVNIANYVSSRGYVHEMHFLNESDSWNLLVKSVFGQERCPTKLKEHVRRIADCCGGLPLALIAMAGILSDPDKTILFWESIGRNFQSTRTQLGLRCSEILLLSYNDLPYYLKPCFLYVGAFPEDYEIRASKIIKLWVAEGIIKPIGDNTLEDAAELYLNDLIDRNLLSVCQQDPDGRVRTFKIHHLLRELCRRKAADEKFLWFRNPDGLEIPENEGMRRMSVHPSYQPCDKMECSMSLVRSFLCFGLASCQLAPSFLDSRLLRVLDVFQIEFIDFPSEIEQLLNLRYLGLSCRSHLPLSIFKFRNLHTLIISLPLFTIIALPYQLWEMTQLKHIQFKKTCIQYCPEAGQNAVRENIETLSNVETSEITELLQRTPNLRKLGIYCDSPVLSVINLACLERLERLNCSSVWPPVHHFLSRLTLPHSLKKLTLSFCNIPLGFMMYVGSLHNLEQLRLKNSDFVVIEGEQTETTELEWAPVNGGFQQLIYLTMENLNLMCWNAESTHFPILQHLVIRGCYALEEIPSDIGCIETLELIEVDEFSPLVRDSALQIQKEQNDLENPLRVVVHHSY